ncbi:MAG TPA: class I SAM-dependent methyltransferase [Alphaproteobacteria bacterium]|nr:class I SAM-dependent methyltransferase [Alphaproteobacteria bacterium]
MSRLDTFIERLLAQRAHIDAAARLIGDRPGPILELGLGNGRTFDHLRARFPGRSIYVFDRELASHPRSRPTPEYFIEGDFRDTLPRVQRQLAGQAILANCDVGSHDVVASRNLVSSIVPLLSPLMAPGGLVLGDYTMENPDWTRMPTPDGVEESAYVMYRVGG